MGTLYAHLLEAHVLEVTGEDAFDYLQSQFSNDLRSDREHPAVYGLWLDRKGKVQADSFVLRLGGESFLLATYFSDPDSLAQRLEANVIADEVEIERTERRLLSLWTAGAQPPTDDLAALTPDPESFRVNAAGSVCFRGRRSAGWSLDCILLPGVETAAMGTPVPADTTFVDEHTVHSHRIAAGIAAVPHDCGPSDLPQEAGLARDAVSFIKGCYLGQEVMARLHAMGQARRRLVPVRLEKPGPAPGALLFHGGQKAGELRSIDPLGGDDGTNALALLKTSLLEEASSFALEANGPDTVRLR